MASVIPKEVKKSQVDTWIAETWKVGLLKDSFVYVTGTHVNWADVSANEVAASGSYVAGGQTVSKYAWGTGSGYVDTTNAMLGAAYSQWTTVSWGVGNAPRYAVVYNTAGAAPIRFIYDFLAEKTATGGTFTIQWSANGLVKVS